jgi:hypothetical protein
MRKLFFICLAVILLGASLPAAVNAQVTDTPVNAAAADTVATDPAANDVAVTDAPTQDFPTTTPLTYKTPGMPVKGTKAVSIGGKSWLLIISPIIGGLQNTIRFKYDVPTGKDETTPREKSLTDTGWGFGLTTVFIWKQLAVTNITFSIPEVNSSNVFGNVLTAQYYWPIHRIIDFALGLGFVYNQINANFENFEDAVTKDGVTATAHFGNFYVKNDIFTLMPKAGIIIHIPIQHWYVKPFVGYMGEWVRVNVHTPGGSVFVPAPINLYKEIPAISTQKDLQYHSVILGAELFLDFHYALQLRTQFYYNPIYGTYTLRAIGSAFFSRKVPLGVTTYFEYSRGISHDNLYLFFGPAVMF